MSWISGELKYQIKSDWTKLGGVIFWGHEIIFIMKPSIKFELISHDEK